MGFLQYSQDFDELYPSGTQPCTTASNCSGYTSSNGIVTGATGWAPVNFGEGWGGQVYPYVTATGVYTCPSDQTKSAAYTTVSYAYNISIGRNDQEVSPVVWKGLGGHISGLVNPAKSVMLCEVKGVADVNVVNTAEADATGMSVATRQYAPVCSGNSYIYTATGWTLKSGLTAPPVATYATGYLIDTTGQTTNLTQPNPFPSFDDRHLGGSDYLFTDGHAKWLLGSSVSAGRPATTPAGVVPNVYGQAAGTSGSLNGAPVEATFSPT